jgi:leucyl-tRNA synthetase
MTVKVGKEEAIARPYEPGPLEVAWQERWRESDAFATAPEVEGANDVYVFAACPFTSGAAHMGHVRSYTITDTYARFRRACGDNVLFSLGFDAFGLPSELSAVERGESPQSWVESCCERMQHQFDRLGFSVDWNRRFVTSEPSMYRWTQWLFLFLLEKGMIHRGTGPVDWCDDCNTTIASLQVEDGRCWRCKNKVRRVTLPQWVLRISAYAEEAERDLSLLHGWNRAAKGAQRSVIGMTKGRGLEVEEVGGNRRLSVFVPDSKRDGAPAFVALSPNHPDVDEWLGAADCSEAATSQYQIRARRDRSASNSVLTQTNRSVRISSGAELPVIITSLVNDRYGAAAVLGVPGADKTDETIAQRLGFDAIDQVVRHDDLSPARCHRVRDFPISRQRSWGAPIPIVNCSHCGAVPVGFDHLPVEMPPPGSEADTSAWAECRCPRCAAPAHRETDTLDCHVDGLWYWLALCVPPGERDDRLFTHPELKRWLPIESVVWGADGGGYMYDIRVLTKILRDEGIFDFLPEGEPFAGMLMHEMVHMSGRKMSKHLGNVVSPEVLIETYGADSVRLAVLYAASPEKAIEWDDAALELCSRFLRRVWNFCVDNADDWRPLPDRPEIGKEWPHARRLLARCESLLSRTLREYHRHQMHKVVRSLIAYEELVHDFHSRADATDVNAAVCAWAMGQFLHLLTPTAPHISEELWSILGGDRPLHKAQWRGELIS